MARRAEGRRPGGCLRQVAHGNGAVEPFAPARPGRRGRSPPRLRRRGLRQPLRRDAPARAPGRARLSQSRAAGGRRAPRRSRRRLLRRPGSRSVGRHHSRGLAGAERARRAVPRPDSRTVSRNTAAYAIPLSAVGILTFAAVVLSGGDLATALAPVAAAVLLYTALVAPLRACVLALMFLALVADAPQDNPMSGLWESPLYGIGRLLCNNWSETFGIRALSFSGMDVLAFLLVARTALSPRSRPLAAPLRD